MQLLFCDSCGRPLSEGALARGEASERDGETICRACETKAKSARESAARQTSGPLDRYAEKVWKCRGCGIPITALDLIEGRASRLGDDVECVRCRQAAPAPVNAAPVNAAPSMVLPAAPAAPTLPSARRPQAPRAASRSAAYLAEARKEERRPVLPIVLIAIVLPMFALSVWYAISTQQKLYEVSSQRSNEPQETARQRPREALTPEEALPPKPTPPAQEQPKAPAEMPAPPRPSVPPPVLEELASIEREAAAPTIRKLESRDLAVVWEGLIEAGSRRLIATRPWVRALLRDSDTRTRALACRVSSLLEDATALGDIDKLAESDPSPDVRDAAHLARARLLGKATRELADMKPDELEALRRQIEEEIKRQKAGGKRD